MQHDPYWWDIFEKEGVIWVRHQLSNHGLPQPAQAFAIRWLADHDINAAKKAAETLEQQRLEDVSRWKETQAAARSANIAAWVAAISSIVLGVVGVAATIYFK